MTDPFTGRCPSAIVHVVRRGRVWAPFVIGFLGATVLYRMEQPIGQFLGVVYNPLLGYAEVELRAGAWIGLVGGVASRTWRGLLMLVLGFATAGAAHRWGDSVDKIVGDALFMVVMLGILGVPAYGFAYTAVMVGSHIIAGLRNPRPPEGIGPGVTVGPPASDTSGEEAPEATQVRDGDQT
jgi:hypothetical protein